MQKIKLVAFSLEILDDSATHCQGAEKKFMIPGWSLAIYDTKFIINLAMCDTRLITIRSYEVCMI